MRGPGIGQGGHHGKGTENAATPPYPTSGAPAEQAYRQRLEDNHTAREAYPLDKYREQKERKPEIAAMRSSTNTPPLNVRG